MAKGFALREDDARRLWLVRAVETRDQTEQLLTREDREQAEHHARQAVTGTKKRAQREFLAARSRFASARLETRHPAFARAIRHSRWPRWLSVGLPALAFIAGALSNELDGGSRLELLAFPLLGIIVWNVAVYLWTLASPLLRRSKTTSGGTWLRRLGNPLSMLGTGGASGGPLTQEVLAGFASDWAQASGKLQAQRASTALHLSAALFALGLVAGIFLRALTVEYRAGWESTFVGAGQVEALLSLVLGPASALTGIAIPDTQGIADLRWTGAATGGANAGPWIILWTATVTGLVAIPRLLLAGWNAARAAAGSARVKVPGREDFYIRRLLREYGGASGEAGGVRVTPYAYTPTDEARLALTNTLRDAMGETAPIKIDPPVPYGGEEDWMNRTQPPGEADIHCVLFSLSATPEEENHATFVRLLRDYYDLMGQGVRVAALLDETPFRTHFAGQAGLDARIEGRVETWAKMMRGASAPFLSLSLAPETDPELAERIESVLLGDSLSLKRAAQK